MCTLIIYNMNIIGIEVYCMKYHFLKVCTVSPNLRLADCKYNTEQIIKSLQEATRQGASLAIYPELCISGYSCADLFFQSTLLDESENSIRQILKASQSLEIVAVVGTVLLKDNSLYNVAIVLSKGKILGIIPKTYLANYGEFYEKRWFASAHNLVTETVSFAGQTCVISPYLIFKCQTIPYFILGIEVCEDLWSTIPPSLFHSLAGATVLANLSASNEIIGKAQYRRDMIAQQSAKTMSAYLFTSSNIGESTSDLVFSGHQLIYENGYLMTESNLFTEKTTISYAIIDLERLIKERMRGNKFNQTKPLQSLNYHCIPFELNVSDADFDRYVEPHPFVPQDESKRKERCKEIFDIQAHGLARRMKHIHSDYLIMGMSGGLDSTLALLVCMKAARYCNLPSSAVMGVTMPGFGTTDRTYQNAINLMKILGVTLKEISIVEATSQHLKNIQHSLDNHDTTYENAQARERTQILMDLANQYNGIVVGTGDLSELALGWATFNGDQMSMYGVNSSVPKTLVRHLIDYVAYYESEPMVQEILFDVLDTPVSPELLPPNSKGEIAQKTEDLVGPYELHDFFIYYALRFGYQPSKIYFLAQKAFKDKYSSEIILKWLKTFYKRFFTHQFKRSSMPDGPKVGSVCLSPRGDLRMPSDAYSEMWLKDLEHITL